MWNFTFAAEWEPGQWDGDRTNKRVSISTDCESYGELAEEFVRFLQAVGYVYAKSDDIDETLDESGLTDEDVDDETQPLSL